MIKQYFKLIREEQSIQNRIRELIISALLENNNRISFVKQPDDEEEEDQGDEYPVTSVLWGKHDTYSINITDVYLDEHNQIFADGIDDDTGCIEKQFQVYREQFSDILHFIGIVLGWDKLEKLTNDNS